jgi:hypothetical protein
VRSLNGSGVKTYCEKKYSGAISDQSELGKTTTSVPGLSGFRSFGPSLCLPMSNLQHESESESESATCNKPQPSNSVENRNYNVSSPEPMEVNATLNPEENVYRSNSWEPPSLFRTLTQQQREDAHKKFIEQQSKPTRTIWHGLYDSYAKVSTSKILENKSSVARDHLGESQIPTGGPSVIDCRSIWILANRLFPSERKDILSMGTNFPFTDHSRRW